MRDDARPRPRVARAAAAAAAAAFLENGAEVRLGRNGGYYKLRRRPILTRLVISNSRPATSRLRACESW